MFRIAWILVMALLLCSCGGGDGENNESGQPPGNESPPSDEVPPPEDDPGEPPPEDPPPEDPPADPPPEEDPPPGEDPPPVEVIGEPWRTWLFAGRDGRGRQETLELDSQGAGELLKETTFGPLAFQLSGRDLFAHGEVYSSESGTTYWVDTEAPIGNVVVPTERIGSVTSLSQIQRYRKRAEDATLKLVVTEATIEAYDYNGSNSREAHCPWVIKWSTGSDAAVRCADRLYGQLVMDVILERDDILLDQDGNVIPNLPPIWESYTGGVQLQGWADNWKWTTFTYKDISVSRRDHTPRAIFRDSQFDFEPVSSSTTPGEVGATVTLQDDVVIEVDLSKVPVDGEFNLLITTTATTDNRRGLESYVRARLKDPLSTGGAHVETTGLEALPTPAWDPPAEINAPFPVCAGGVSGNGTVQFSSDTYLVPEFGSPGPTILLTRTGGNRGPAVVTVQTSGGTAVPNSDYQPFSQQIAFHDGDDAPIGITLPIFDNDVADGDRTIELILSAEDGCATLGSRTAAVFTIVDDEQRAEENTYTVGGTVTGLQGTGLVLEDIVTGSQVTPGNGPFTLGFEYREGDTYDVRIITEPTQPAQACTITNGAGTIGTSDVTDITVSCSAPATGAMLDPSFGDGGRVTSGINGEGRALALQPDGKIVAIGRSQLARFNADGSVDTSFGDNGLVTSVFSGVFGEEAQDVAVQPDGRILVVGFTRAGLTTTDYDFAIARFNPEGSPDITFGTDGLVTVDFEGQPDRAWRVKVLDDGRILVGGHAGRFDPEPTGDQHHSFALVRLLPDGSLDTSFGVEPTFTGSGKVMAFSDVSFAYALAIAPDGKILLGGRTGADGAANPEAALVRFSAYGTEDNETDSDPTVYFGVDGTGRGSAVVGDGGAVRDMLVTADGRIWGVVQGGFAGAFNFRLVRFLTPYGTQVGRPAPYLLSDEVPVGPGNDFVAALAQQADGKLLAAGTASSATTVSDFGLVRYHEDGSLDTSFGNNGVLTIDFFGGTDGALDVEVQPDGKILMIGSARNGSSNGLGLVRVVP